MATSISLTYEIDAAKLRFDDSGRTVTTASGSALGAMRSNDPISFTAIQEFHSLGTTSGSVTITAT